MGRKGRPTPLELARGEKAAGNRNGDEVLRLVTDALAQWNRMDPRAR